MYEEVDESIDVITQFSKGKVLPLSFNWQNRPYPIDKIALVHQEYRGEVVVYLFSVVSKGNNYELVFDTKHLSWRLGKVWQE